LKRSESWKKKSIEIVGEQKKLGHRGGVNNKIIVL
jgi:hypothetical protein